MISSFDGGAATPAIQAVPHGLANPSPRFESRGGAESSSGGKGAKFLSSPQVAATLSAQRGDFSGEACLTGNLHFASIFLYAHLWKSG